MLSVAAVQFASVLGDVPGNLEAMRRIARAQKQRDRALGLLVFPELCTTGYECGAHFAALAEEIHGPSMAYLSALAAELSCCIAYGFARRDGAGRPYNSMAFLDGEGKHCGVYDKVHLFEEERSLFAPGKRLPVLDTPLGRVGMMICWDLAFPEAARCLALSGASLLLSGSAWEYPYAGNYTLSCKARAYENCLPHVAANRVGKEPVNRFIGHSAVYAAGGDTLCILEHEQSGVAAALLDQKQDAIRTEQEYAFLKHRQPEAYRALL